MFLLLVSLVTTLAVLWVLRKWHRAKNYWANKNVPHDPLHPVLGSLTFVLKQNFGLWLRDLYSRFKSPYVGIWLFWRPALVVNSPELARNVLVRDAAVFRNKFLSGGKKDPIGDLNIFAVDDPLWSTIRRRLTPVFTAAKLRNFQDKLNMKGEDLLQRIKMEKEKDKDVDLRIMYTDYTTDVVGMASFGVASDTTLTGEGPLRIVTRDFMKFSYRRGLSLCCNFFIPELVDVFGCTLFPKKTTTYFRTVFKDILNKRGGYEREIKENRDLFDALVKIKQESDRKNEDMPEDILIAQAAAFLQGGFDSTGSILTLCTYELAYNPAVQERLYTEILDVKEKHFNNDLDDEILKNIKYLDCVLKETLRKYPPIGWLDRVAAKDYQIDEKVTIPAGTPVYINVSGLHYDPENYPDPLKFDPERFMPENENKIRPFTFLTFGEGPRNCIGGRFAMLNLRNVMTKILLKYKIVPKPNTPRPEEIEMEKKNLLTFPGEEIHVQFIPRGN